MSAPAKAVPKFTSFRAKAPPTDQQPSLASQKHERKRERSPEQHGSIKRHKTPDQDDRVHTSHKPDRVRSDGRHRQASHRSHDGKRPEKHTGSLYESDLFTVDRKGDIQNVTYQSLHKYSVPPYHRLGYGLVLGLGPRLRIDRDESAQDKVYLVDKASRMSRPQRLLLKRPKNADIASVRPQPDVALDMAQDFVALSDETDKRRQSNSSNEHVDAFRHLQSSEQQIARSLDIDDKIKPSADVDSQARQTNAELHRAAKFEPTNLQAWLDLATHQQYLVRPGVDPSALTNHERQILADMRISIYEKALKYYPADDAADRERLIISLLEEASLAWDSQKYMQKLRDILQQHPSSFVIWTKYLVAAQANPSGFRFEDVKSFFLRCLRDVRENSATNQTTLLYLILRYTVFLLDTGYTELSIAIWQALGEFHYFKPEKFVGADRELVLSDFELFWESEAPRFGESGAQGWHHYSTDDLIVPEAQTHDQDTPRGLSTKLPFKSFASLEQTATSCLRFPGRTLEEVDSDDPFHIVFFSDLKEIIEATAGGFDRSDFLDALLCYLGLPPISKNVSIKKDFLQDHEWRSDVFLDQGLMQHDSVFGLENVPRQTQSEHYQMSTDTLFSRTFQRLSACEKAMEDASGKDSTSKTPAFTKRVLASLVCSCSDDDTLTEYYLAFVLAFFPSEASKTAKNIVKNRPSLRLYNACANIEARLGRLDKAGKIWSGTINMKDSFPTAVQQDIFLLWRDWIWAELKANHSRRALSCLAAVGGEVNPQTEIPTEMSTASFLRIRRALKDGFEHAISQSLPQVACANVELMALTTYLTETGALEAAVSIINDHCTLSKRKVGQVHTILLELLHQAKAGLLAYHVEQKRPYKPSFIRSEMEASIVFFPNNTLFLELYRDNEARFRIDDRVRSILRDQVLSNSQIPIVGWTFAIEQEIARYKSQSSGSTADSVRSTFSRALLTVGSPVRHSQTLWMSWFQFELDLALKELSEPRPTRKRGTGASQPLQELNKVLLSGLHHLPWSKIWILRGLEVFDREDTLGWNARELRRLYNVLVERELRVRVEGLEDILDKAQTS